MSASRQTAGDSDRGPVGSRRAVRTIDDVLRSVEEAKVEPCQIAGLSVVMGSEATAADRRRDAQRILAAFAGPYGGQRRESSSSEVAWCGALPGPEQVLSTWSDYADTRGICVVEGEFYSEAWEYRPRVGPDPDLARLVLERVSDRGPGEIEQLNGLFSGFVYLAAERRLLLFVDRVGARFLFYRRVGDRCEAASDIYGFRGTGNVPDVDALSLNEQLVFGAPCSGRTLLRGVHLVPPGHVVEISSGGGVREITYHRYPNRLERQSLAEGTEMVCAALDRHVRNLGLTSRPSGIALSGGKDSRVVLAALQRGGVRPVSSTFTIGRNEADLGNALRLAELAGLDSQVVSYPSGRDPWVFDWDHSIMTLGYFAGWGFLALGAAAALRSRILLTGYTGDALSGSTSGVTPWRESSVSGLAMRQFGVQEPAVAPELVPLCVRPDLLVPHDRLLESFVESFRREVRDSEDFNALYLRHRLSHRNRWRAGSNFHGLRVHAIPVHPFADRFVMDAYLSLPEKSLAGQPVHCLAAMRGAPEFGDVPTGDNPFSLRVELAARHFMMPGKQLLGGWRRLRASAPRQVAMEPPGPRHVRLLQAARESGLFVDDLPRLPSWQDPRNRGAAAKLGSTAIHFAGATGLDLPAAPKPLFLRGLAAAAPASGIVRQG